MVLESKSTFVLKKRMYHFIAQFCFHLIQKVMLNGAVKEGRSSRRLISLKCRTNISRVILVLGVINCIILQGGNMYLLD